MPGFSSAAGEKPAPDVPPQAPGLARWNESRINMYRFYVTLYSFVVMGMNDGAIGVGSCPPAELAPTTIR